MDQPGSQRKGLVVPDLPNPADVFDKNPDTPQGRPKAVMAIASLGVIFGAMGVVCLPWGLMPYVYSATWPPVFIEGNPMLSWWVIGASLLGTALSILLLVGSVGSFSLQRWARPVMLLYGAISVLFGLVGIFFYFRWFAPAFRQEMTGARDVGPLGGLLSWIIATVFAVAVLYVMTRPHVRAVFTKWRREPADQSGTEGDE